MDAPRTHSNGKFVRDALETTETMTGKARFTNLDFLECDALAHVLLK